MPELIKKIDKGESAYIAISQLMVTLRWTSPVDLDLMAFYKAKDNRQGGICSASYPGGSHGSLNQFPYMLLDGDSGTDEQSGDHQETIRIAKLNEMAEVYICTLNYSAAIAKEPATFGKYDAVLTLIDNNSNTITAPLNSQATGYVAIIAKIVSDFMGAKLLNESRVMDLEEFAKLVPGTDLILKP